MYGMNCETEDTEVLGSACEALGICVVDIIESEDCHVKSHLAPQSRICIH